MAGPLEGIKIVEMVGIGPGPFCAMMLADMGAEVIRIDQKRETPVSGAYALLNTRFDVQARGRKSIALNLKSEAGAEVVRRLVDQADALIEGYRPGVMERLGLGPDLCLERNPRLVYGRMTGWGQSGPLAHAAGHDLNYIALSGALAAMGRPDSPPAPPLNLVGDYGGGGMMLAFGIVCAVLQARKSGQGQVVDAAMTDGSAALMAMFYGLKAGGQWTLERGANLLDGGAHFYDTYACADGKYITLGAIEPQFYKQLLELVGASDPDLEKQMSVRRWPELKAKLAALFLTRSRQDWCVLLEGTDVCFAPVLDMDEAPLHAHNAARNTFIDIDGVIQPAPAPRFSKTAPAKPCRPAAAGEHSAEILRQWAFGADEIDKLKSASVI